MTDFTGVDVKSATPVFMIDPTTGLAASSSGVSSNIPLGYQQITDLSAAVGLTVPTGALFAMIQAETAAVRYRDDGVDPTATVGQALNADDEILYSGDLSAIKFIQKSAGAVLNVSYYK
jgi:hypothetical protein